MCLFCNDIFIDLYRTHVMLHEYWFDDKQKVDFWENELKSLF